MLSTAFEWALGVKQPSQLGPVLEGSLSAESINRKKTVPRPKKAQQLRRGKQLAQSSPNTLPTGAKQAERVDDARDLPVQEPVPRAPCGVNLRSSLPMVRSSTLDMLAKPAIEQKDDAEVVKLLLKGEIRSHALEKYLGDPHRAVTVRRLMLEEKLARDGPVLQELAHGPEFNYGAVQGQCCENVIGYVPLPVGMAGPLLLNGEEVHLPMATTEGCLVASTHRGCKAINASGGASACLLATGMTRAPVVQMPSAMRAASLKQFIEGDQGFNILKEAFDSTTNFGRLRSAKAVVAGKTVYIRFKSTTGDAMGMNMVSKGTEKALAKLLLSFPDMNVLSLSGNLCTDKKASAINWVDGRGRSVVCEAVIQSDVVKSVLKTSVDRLVLLNTQKNLVGSAMAGSLGGFNAHASNIVTAIFLATGQDVAQNVESSACITLMEATEAGDLRISVTMPSIEVGTIGGGTVLQSQAACLDIIGVKGPNRSHPGRNADKLAMTVAGAVLAGELSLMAALAAGHLVRSHMRLNRSSDNLKAMDVR